MTGECSKKLLLNGCMNKQAGSGPGQTGMTGFGLSVIKPKHVLSMIKQIGSYTLSHRIVEKRCESTLKISLSMETELLLYNP